MTTRIERDNDLLGARLETALDNLTMDEIERLRRIEAAVIYAHSQRADDRCWMDISKVYEAAGLPPPDNRVGDKAAMLGNCKRFIDAMCEGGGWLKADDTIAALTRRSQAELSKAMLAELDRLREENGELRSENCRLSKEVEMLRAITQSHQPKTVIMTPNFPPRPRDTEDEQ